MTTPDGEYCHHLIDHVGFIVIGVDRDLRIRSWNRCAAAQFGADRSGVEDLTILDLLAESEREPARRLFDAATQNGVAGEMEVRFTRSDGSPGTLILIVSPVKGADGVSLGASACMRDISERKRLSQELSRAQRMTSLGDMAAGVAHHFNNILAGMLTSIEYVLPSDSPRELRRTLRLVAQAIGRATRITKQLEAFAEAQHDESEWEDLAALVRKIAENVRPQAAQFGIQVDVNIADVSTPAFETQRIMPVLESIAQNAIDAMPSGGTLTIGLGQQEDHAVITVGDTGCGIPEDVLDRIFEPFFTTKGELAGGSGANIGLGLAAVHGLVAEMGGTIQVRSRMAEGTTVELRFPTAPRRRPDTDAAGAARGPVPRLVGGRGRSG